MSTGEEPGAPIVLLTSSTSSIILTRLSSGEVTLCPNATRQSALATSLRKPRSLRTCNVAREALLLTYGLTYEYLPRNHICLI